MLRRIVNAFPVLGFWLSLAILMTVGTLAQRRVVALVEVNGRVEHTHEVIDALDAVILLLRDANVGRRGYALAGDPAELAAFERARDALAARRATLPALVADNAVQSGRVRALEPLLVERLSGIAQSIAYRQAQGFDREREEAFQDESRKGMKVVRERVGAMVADERALLRDREATEQERAVSTGRALMAGAALSVCLLALAFSMLHRENGKRRRTEGELRRSEESLTATLNSMGDAVIATDVGGRIARMNPVAERLVGWAFPEAEGRPFAEVAPLLDPATRTPRGDVVSGALEAGGGAGVAGNQLLITRRGAEISISGSGASIRDGAGQVSGAVFVLRDCTAEIEERTRFQRLLAAAPDAIVIAAADGRITLVNDQATALFGHGRAELLDLTIEDLLPERLRGRHSGHRGGFHAVPSTRSLGTTGPTLLGLRRDGTEFPVEISLSPLETAEGVLVIASVRDVTAQRAAAVVLREAKESAEIANRELEAFSYSVAHDLRSPLAGIDGLTQALLEDHADRLDDEGLNHLKLVRATTQRMGRLIDGLLDLARVTRREIRREAVDLSALAREAIGRLERASPGRRVAVTIQDGLVAHADPRLMSIVLDNLLGNAWKFTSKTGDVRIEVGQSADGERPFHVRDNGAGFDMACAAKKLFGVFERFHGAREFDGTGIGLATVERIVRRHRGRIWGEGEVDRGATFYFTLASADPGA